MEPGDDVVEENKTINAATQVLPVVKKEAPKSRAAMRQAILKMEPADDVVQEKKTLNVRLLEEMDITLLKLWNSAAMTTVYNELSTAWQRRLRSKARDRSMILTAHERTITRFSWLMQSGHHS